MKKLNFIKKISAKLIIFGLGMLILNIILVKLLGLKNQDCIKSVHFLGFAILFLGGVGNGMNFLEAYKKSIFYIGFIKYLIIFSNILFFIISMVLFLMSLIHFIEFVK